MLLTNDPHIADRDAQILDGVRRRDAAAIEQLVTLFGDRAYRLATSITGNPQDAEEAVQDAFWNVVRKIDSFRGDAALGSWIYRIAANAACERRRSTRRRRDTVPLDDVLPFFGEDGRHADPIVDWSAGMEDPAVLSALRSALTSAIDELPDHYRAVIVLHDLDGMRMAEVAECLGITVSSAKVRAHRARLLLRQRLGTFMSDRSTAAALHA